MNQALAGIWATQDRDKVPLFGSSGCLPKTRSPIATMRFAVLLFLTTLVACSGRLESPTIISATLINTTPAPSAASEPRDPKLVLPLEVNQTAAETFIRLAFGLEPNSGFQSTFFLTPRLRTVQAAKLIRLVGDYNEFNGTRVADNLLRFRGRVSGIEFGREGSPVIYLELPYWTHQREEVSWDGQGTRISDAESAALVADIKQVFVGDLKADEFSVDKRRVRVWWD